MIDDQPNTYLDVASTAHTLKRRARWLGATCGYDYAGCHRAGRLNVADPVSRAPQHFATLQPTALLALQVARHAASAGKLPTPQCCTLCALKPNRLACRSFARDAEANGVTRRAQGLHTSDGGGDTPPANFTNSAANELADVSYPAGSADDELSVSSYALRNFIQQFQSGYDEDQKVSPPEFDYIRLNRDATGLYWTNSNQLVVPKYDNLRKEMSNQYTSTPSQVIGA